MSDLDLADLQQSVFHHPNRVFIPKSSDRKFNHGFQNPAGILTSTNAPINRGTGKATLFSYMPAPQLFFCQRGMVFLLLSREIHSPVQKVSNGRDPRH